MPTYDVRPSHYARAVGIALAGAVGGGMLWWAADLALLLMLNVRIPMLPALMALPLGLGVGEAIAWSVNRKRSTGLAWIAGGSVVAGFLIYLQLPGYLGLPEPFFGGLFGLLFVGLGVLLAIQRVRR